MSAGRTASVEAEVTFLLDHPVTVVRNYDGVSITGRVIQWRSFYNGPEEDTDNFGYISVVLYGDGDNTQVAGSAVRPGDDVWHEPEVPEWCLLPPDGWDAHVRDFREQCEREVAS